MTRQVATKERLSSANYKAITALCAQIFYFDTCPKGGHFMTGLHCGETGLVS